ncbi:hypothetical protein VB715_13205 [Crocosphaera sp. UHCC 0190]|uniref:hypothetical protein n=1 Tax=Crocosphaera sp. UHCC 0190 TaxID=3110246 RepID=UPI002B1F6CA2|nr:hypothetical protein [Crocosphaera sp. UHCC 0190]MEA5510725.1 hypothetical protein [Crocosphaera sp. UHCC 0190]
MNTEEQARELLAQQHLTDEERHAKMVNRALEVEQVHQEDAIAEKARELLVEERQQEATVEANMLHRAVEEIQ